MVVAAFPLAKIGLLLLKQLSKPLANMIKNRAKTNPTVRRKIIIPTGKVYRSLENMVVVRKGEKPEVLSDEEAVELGANAIGEIILFGILTMILLAEINRQGDKKAGIQKIKDDEMTNMKDLVLELADDVFRMNKKISKIENEIKIASDVMQLEEASHSAVYDFDFLDVITNRKKKFGRKGIDRIDESSPSW